MRDYVYSRFTTDTSIRLVSLINSKDIITATGHGWEGGTHATTKGRRSVYVELYMLQKYTGMQIP